MASNIEQAIRGLIALLNLQFTKDAQVVTQGINVKVVGEMVRIDASYFVPELAKISREHKDGKASSPSSPNN